MGGKLSKTPDHRSLPQEKKSYQNVLRAYAKWEHHSALVNHDVSRFATQEIRNFKRHNQQNITNQSHPSSTEKPRHDQNIHGKSLSLQKSHSFNQLSTSKNLITAEQLIKIQSQRRQRYPSSFSQNETTPKPSSAINENQLISSKNKTKQIPLDLQLILINQYDIQVKVIYFIIHIIP
jgi:hypothetical protein